LWRNLVRLAPHVDLLIHVDTGDDEEDPGTSSSTGEKAAKAKYDGALVLLDHFDDEEKGEGKGGDDHEEGGDSEETLCWPPPPKAAPPKAEGALPPKVEATPAAKKAERLQGELKHAASCTPPELPSLLVVGPEVRVAEQAHVLQDTLLVRQAAAPRVLESRF